MVRTDTLPELIKWQKKNFYLRIFIIVLLLAIGTRVLYNHYGVPPSLEDQKLTKDTFGNITEIIDCRSALVYYAKHSGLIDSNKAKNISLEFNLTYMDNFIS